MEYISPEIKAKASELISAYIEANKLPEEIIKGIQDDYRVIFNAQMKTLLDEIAVPYKKVLEIMGKINKLKGVVGRVLQETLSMLQIQLAVENNNLNMKVNAFKASFDDAVKNHKLFKLQVEKDRKFIEGVKRAWFRMNAERKYSNDRTNENKVGRILQATGPSLGLLGRVYRSEGPDIGVAMPEPEDNILKITVTAPEPAPTIPTTKNASSILLVKVVLSIGVALMMLN
jgi:hypothetical protein